MIDYKSEARALGNYLIGQTISTELQQRYHDGVVKLGYYGCQADEALINMCLKHKWKITLLDSTTILLDKNHLLRRKMLLIFSIIETTPDYFHLFYPDGKRLKLLMKIMKAGIIGVGAALLGLIFFGPTIMKNKKIRAERG